MSAYSKWEAGLAGFVVAQAVDVGLLWPRHWCLDTPM